MSSKVSISKMMKRREEGNCPFCNEKIYIEDFDGLLSIREFAISGLCQQCQNEFFGEPDEEGMGELEFDDGMPPF